MADGDVRLEPLAEAHRDALKAACAEDLEIWPIYSTSYGPDISTANFDAMLARPDWCPSPCSRWRRWSACRASWASTCAAWCSRSAAPITSRPMRGTGFNGRVKDLMLARAFACGFRRIEFRVDARNARSPGGAGQDRRGAGRRAAGGPDHLDRPCPRHRAFFSILASEWRRLRPDAIGQPRPSSQAASAR